MNRERVVEAFRLEAGQLARAMTEVSEAEWHLPTRCEPWKVCDLLAHVRVVIAWLPDMLTAPAPTRAEVSAAEYYRPDDRFAPETNAARIALAQAHAAEQLSGTALVEDFKAIWQRVDRLCRVEPEGRVVCTRHSDRQPVVDRVVKGQPALGLQLEDHRGDQRLGRAGHAEIAVGRDRAASVQVGGAAGGDRLPTVRCDHADLHTADTEGVDRLGVLAQPLHGGGPGGLGAGGGRAGGEQRSDTQVPWRGAFAESNS